MRKIWICLVLPIIVLFEPSMGCAEERVSDFLQGLRDLRYYDTARDYLNDYLPNNSNLPPDFKAIIPFEKAIIEQQSVQSAKSPEAQNQQLDRALAYLLEFVRKSPNHPKAGDANTQRARILLGKGRVEVWQSRSPSKHDRRAAFQQRARQFVAQAREIFSTAHKQHETVWKKFPTYIPQDTAEARREYAARKTAEIAYIRAQLDLALSSYEEAQTYDKEAAEFKQRLTTAAAEFRAIHDRYRTQVGGLYARMWQGKCFEEQEDIQRAIGIYNELLGHTGTSGALRRLQNQVFQFRLICLNHNKKEDYKLVVLEATPWLVKFNRSYARTLVGIGIRWQRALAYDAQAANRTLTPKDRTQLLQKALKDVKEVNSRAGEYKDVSTFKMRELMVKLKGDAGDPENFDTAFGIARELKDRIKPLKDAYAAARDAVKSTKSLPERDAAQKKLDQASGAYFEHLGETIRILQMALGMVDDSTTAVDVNRARYLLSYAHYLNRDNYESAILGEYLARLDAEDSSFALDGAYLALAAFIGAYNDAKKFKEVDLQQLGRICNMIAEKWPNSDKANEARMNMGRVHKQLAEPVKAAEWFGKVPVSASAYAEAQTEAGQSYWQAFIEESAKTEDQRRPADELKRWQDAAEKHLRKGIEKIQSGLPETGSSPAELIAAKVSLVQIISNKGNFEGALEQLTGARHSVLTAVAVPDESKRPPAPNVKSAAFAAEVYRLLLRSYIGAKKLNEARDAMQKLEEIIQNSSQDPNALTEIYRQLGGELQKELETLKGIGDQDRLAEVRDSFESFLGQMFERPQQSYNSLLWISETYFSLALGSADNLQKQQLYYDRASESFDAIIQLAKEKPDTVDPARLAAVKLRQVNCKTRKGDFENAAELIAEVLADRPNALDAQFEAASLHQAWGESNKPGMYEKYPLAISGASVGSKKAKMWGWRLIGLKLQRRFSVDRSSMARYGEQYLQARFNAPFCQLQFARKQTSSNKRNAELTKAKLELQAFIAVSSELDEQWWAKFDLLYQDIQVAMGKTVIEQLVKPEPVIHLVGTTSQDVAATTTNKKPVKEAVIVPEDKEGSRLGIIIFAVVAFVGGGIGVFFMLKGGGRRTRAYMPATAPVFQPGSSPEPIRTRSAHSKQARAKKLSISDPTSADRPAREKSGEDSASPNRTKRVKRKPTDPEKPSPSK